MLLEVGREGREHAVLRRIAAGLPAARPSAAHGAEVANPGAVDLLQGELNWEQMCGLQTSGEEPR